MTTFRYRTDLPGDEPEPGQVLINVDTHNRWRILTARQVRPHPAHEGAAVWSLQVERMADSEPDPPIDDWVPFVRDHRGRRR